MHIRPLTFAIVAVSLVTYISSTATAIPQSQPLNRASQHRINTAKLPGLDKSLVALPQWSGEMPVGNNHTLFFWHVQAKNPASDNLIFWYNGGPGCSSLAGLFSGNGPYQTNDDDESHSWHNLGHVVYIDQPFGTGFSTDNVTVLNEDVVGDTMVQFYLNFFETFPEMRKKRVYLAGESYSGRYVPYMAKHVLDYNAGHESSPINLQVIAIGNGLIDLFINTQITYQVPFLEEHPWLVGNNQTWLLSRFAEKMKSMPGCAGVKTDHEVTDDCSLLQDQYYSFSPNPVDFPLSKNCTYPEGIPIYYDNYNIGLKDCETAKSDTLVTQASFEKYLNLPAVQAQIHISKPQFFKACVSLFPTHRFFDPSIVPKYFIGNLVDRGLKVILYSGLLDSAVTHTTTEAALREITCKGHRGFQHSKMTAATMKPIVTGHPTKLSGHYHSERGMTYVTLSNAGHKVPRDDPATASWMIEKLVLKN
ncbi:hypothetical protein BGX26_006206 [Mortierella sp. AD094]|nr:hypothetical protein BGX26_006206 [Mortierella sp. AD094]